MNLLVKLLSSTLSVAIAAYLIPGVYLDNWLTAVVVAVILGVLNVLVKPFLILLTLPITILTLGLFLLVINVLIVYLADALIAGFAVDSFISALLFAFTLSIASWFLAKLT